MTTQIIRQRLSTLVREYIADEDTLMGVLRDAPEFFELLLQPAETLGIFLEDGLIIGAAIEPDPVHRQSALEYFPYLKNLPLDRKGIIILYREHDEPQAFWRQLEEATR